MNRVTMTSLAANSIGVRIHNVWAGEAELGITTHDGKGIILTYDNEMLFTEEFLEFVQQQEAL